MLVLERSGQPGPLDVRRGAARRHLQQRGVGTIEFTRHERTDMEHANQLTLDDQGDAEQRSDSLLAEDRVEDVRMVDVLDEDRDAFGGDPSGESFPDRDPDPLLDLLLDSLRCARDQLLGLFVVEEDRDRVDRQRAANPEQQLFQQILESELRQTGVAQPVKRLKLLGRNEFDRDRSEDHLPDSRFV